MNCPTDPYITVSIIPNVSAAVCLPHARSSRSRLHAPNYLCRISQLYRGEYYHGLLFHPLQFSPCFCEPFYCSTTCFRTNPLPTIITSSRTYSCNAMRTALCLGLSVTPSSLHACCSFCTCSATVRQTARLHHTEHRCSVRTLMKFHI